MSGGMRQRVMTAMALACDPDLLIADEPTTALDVTIQAQILALLSELRDKIGMAVILITHDLGVVAETADRVVVMYCGQVVEEATARAALRAPAAPLHARAAGVHPHHGGHRVRRAALHDPRHGSQPAQPAEGLRVRSALRPPDGALRGRACPSSSSSPTATSCAASSTRPTPPPPPRPPPPPLPRPHAPAVSPRDPAADLPPPPLQVLPDGHRPPRPHDLRAQGRRRPVAGHLPRRDVRPGGRVRLRQDDRRQAPGRPLHAHRRRDHLRRPRPGEAQAQGAPPLLPRDPAHLPGPVLVAQPANDGGRHHLGAHPSQPPAAARQDR